MSFKIKKSREYWSEREVYEESIKQIRSIFGLNLSIIERIELKRFVPAVLDGRDDITDQTNRYDPVGEAINRFMQEYYQLPFELSNVHTRLDTNSELYAKNPEEFKDYLRISQFRKHNPFAFEQV